MAGKKREGGEKREEMNWLSRKLFLYNVTFGLYALDWWEQCLFNLTIVLIILWLICYNTSRSMWRALDNNLKNRMQLGRGNNSMVELS